MSPEGVATTVDRMGIRGLAMAREDMKALDLLDRLSKCTECVGDSPGGAVFGCEKCLEQLAREVMET